MGKICQRSCGWNSARDHPREYGENPCRFWVSVPLPGPSPRIRGKSSHCPHRGGIHGTIPANTGRICPSTPCPLHPWDHPREYGENLATSAAQGVAKGPSPRIRGESGQDGFRPGSHGTIPANTGRMYYFTRFTFYCWDHPREYGENTGRRDSLRNLTGPSPRIRREYRRVSG